MSYLVLEGIHHAYEGVSAVKDVNLAVNSGELICLLGPSGCGKSTTLRIVAGLEEPQKGRVLVDNKVMTENGLSRPPETRHIGLVFQDYALFPHLSNSHNITFGLRGISAAEKRRIADGLLERVGLAGYGDKFPHMLSGGEQQRVALARALAPNPRVMLLDEPFSGLDVVLRDEVRDQTLSLLKESGTTTMLVTHDPQEAMRMADRIVLMEAGRIVQQGAPRDLYNHPVNAFAARFFSEINELMGYFITEHSVDSPWGPIPIKEGARGATAGSKADILIRPEAIRLEGPQEGSAQARVVDERLLGPVTLARFELADGTLLTARLPAATSLSVGAEVDLTLDLAQTFIFPA